ncbi:MAG: bifunctional methylenetetrahydrofolate dehydrogenase/methenyltetrahydrofolate cyclohydrolase FolD [Clostridia bacterium]|nr:bifunctional methylenetetrahydrofolate dehydrogenase/methenyltetrahydrofolate cyclohydrolase FolD [Clostridia bacterium]
MIILDGKKTSTALKQSVREMLDKAYETTDKKCSLAIVMVGNNPASEVYVGNKSKSADACNILAKTYKLPENTTEEELVALMDSLGKDENVHGIIVQLPLPKHLDGDKMTELVPSEKDVDGFTTQSLGKLALGKDGFVSCTPAGIVYMLKYYDIDLKGKHAVIIGRSKIVGKPLALALLEEDCTVTVCHSKTKNLAEITKTADIVVAAIGRPNFVTEDMVKDGAIVVDVGINRTENGLCGDVDFENVKNKASYITPVPGGVGPMTVAMLMANTAKAFCDSLKK